jgi:hypothetical protein
LYWGKATVIYPVCNNNLYIISPTVPNPLSRVNMERFGERFRGESLAQYLSFFSQPNSINQVTK